MSAIGQLSFWEGFISNMKKNLLNFVILTIGVLMAGCDPAEETPVTVVPGTLRDGSCPAGQKLVANHSHLPDYVHNHSFPTDPPVFSKMTCMPAP